MQNYEFSNVCLVKPVWKEKGALTVNSMTEKRKTGYLNSG